MDIRERLRERQRANLKTDLTAWENSDPIYTDALAEITRLEAGMVAMVKSGCGCYACTSALLGAQRYRDLRDLTPNV